MLTLARNLGYETLVATPHFGDPETCAWPSVDQETAWLAAEAKAFGITILHGYEIRIHPQLAGWLEGSVPMSLAGTRTLLLELPFAGWPTYTERVIFDVQALGYRVLLAHPERYESVLTDPGILAPLRERGVLMQLTTGSLAGLFGKRSKAISEQLLGDGFIDVLASDAHSAGRRFVAVAEGMARANELVGADGVRLLTETNPRAILEDEPVQPIQMVGGRSAGLKVPTLSMVRKLIPGR